jgi:hypothetical protein
MPTGYDLKFAKAFFDLPVEGRLNKIIDNSFPSWIENCNNGVSLIYANACKMMEGVTEKVLETDEDHLGPFEVFASSTAYEVETGYDLYNPDTGGIVPLNEKGEDGYFYMLETGIRSMSCDDGVFDPRWLIPENPETRPYLVKKYGKVFSVQLRFWSHDSETYKARYDEYKAMMAKFPDVKVVEKELSASLRSKFRFRPKRKEKIDLVDTKVTAIAVGIDF